LIYTDYAVVLCMKQAHMPAQTAGNIQHLALRLYQMSKA
jgi:hypothetical protein